MLPQPHSDLLAAGVQAVRLLCFLWVLYLNISALNVELGWASAVATLTEQRGNDHEIAAVKLRMNHKQEIETTHMSINR